MSKVQIQNLSLNFRIYNDAMPSLKESFASFFSSKKKKGYSTFPALKNISISIGEGERIGIIGHNGAGKSTLLKSICRIYEPTSGTIKVDGKIAPLLEIGAGFHHEYTGRENIYLNGVILGSTYKELKKLEGEIIEFAGLQDFIDMPVKYYSTGMYMRLAFALATTVNPDILILDELFAGGDSDFIKKASARMAQLINDANVMILVSHDLGLLEKFCGRVIWLDHGEVRMDGDAKDILSKYHENSGLWK